MTRMNAWRPTKRVCIDGFGCALIVTFLILNNGPVRAGQRTISPYGKHSAASAFATNVVAAVVFFSVATDMTFALLTGAGVVSTRRVRETVTIGDGSWRDVPNVPPILAGAVFVRVQMLSAAKEPVNVQVGLRELAPGVEEQSAHAVKDCDLDSTAFTSDEFALFARADAGVAGLSVRVEDAECCPVVVRVEARRALGSTRWMRGSAGTARTA